MTQWQFSGDVVILGFGSVARTAIPMIVSRFSPKRIVVLDLLEIDPKLQQSTATEAGLTLIHEPTNSTTGTLRYIHHTLTRTGLRHSLSTIIPPGAITFDFMFGVESLDTLLAVQACGSLYLNSSMEEWEEAPYPTVAALYSRVDDADTDPPRPTAAIDCGANPGLVTHFVRIGLRHMARLWADHAECPTEDKAEIEKLLEDPYAKGVDGRLSCMLDLQTVHISEHDTIAPAADKVDLIDGQFTNTWSINSLRDEWFARGEIAVSPHDYPALPTPGPDDDMTHHHTRHRTLPYPVYMKSRVPVAAAPTAPGSGAEFIGRVVRHPETLEISTVLRHMKHDGTLVGDGVGPTVAFVYRPALATRAAATRPDAHEMPATLITEAAHGPLEGSEAMGAVLVSGRPLPAIWYGSVLTSVESRRLGCKTNATVLQVAVSAVTHMELAMAEPNRGLVMPSDFDSGVAMERAAPLLGYVAAEQFSGMPAGYADLVVKTVPAVDSPL